MKKISTKIIALICIYSLVLAGMVFATENSLLIELPQKINESFAKITRISHQQDIKTKNNEKIIKAIVKKLQGSRNKGETYSLKQEYFANRAENLTEQSFKFVSIENELISIVQNMDQLEQARNDSRKFGMGAGIERNDIEAQQAVKGMLKGFESMLNMVNTLDPKINLSNQYDTFDVMNSMAKEFFTNSSNDSLEIQKKFIMETLSLSKSIQNLLRSEHNYLLTCLFYIDSDYMIQQFGTIKQSILGDGTDIKNIMQHHHPTDKTVLDHGKSTTMIRQANYNRVSNQSRVNW